MNKNKLNNTDDFEETKLSKALDDVKTNNYKSTDERKQDRKESRKISRKKEKESQKKYRKTMLGTIKPDSVKEVKNPLEEDKQKNYYNDDYVKGKINWKKTFIILSIISVIGVSGFLIWFYPIGGQYAISTKNTVERVFNNIFLEPNPDYCKDSTDVPEELKPTCYDMVAKNKIGYMGDGPYYSYTANGKSDGVDSIYLGPEAIFEGGPVEELPNDNNQYNAIEGDRKRISFDDFGWEIYTVPDKDNNKKTYTYQIQTGNQFDNQYQEPSNSPDADKNVYYFVDYSMVYSDDIISNGPTKDNLEYGYLSPYFQVLINNNKLVGFVFFGINGYPRAIKNDFEFTTVAGPDGQPFTAIDSRKCKDVYNNNLSQCTAKNYPVKDKEGNQLAISVEAPELVYNTYEKSKEVFK